MRAVDRIVLSGVRGRGHHGVFEHERRDGQDFVVDVSIAVDLAPAGASDDLADTVNYGEIGAAVLARIEGEPFDLIERLAEVIAADALSHPGVDEVTVTVHKPQAPVGVPFGDVTVTVTRRRAPLPVVIALGANLPRGEQDPRESLAAAVLALRDDVGLSALRCSSVFDTDPVGGPDQPTYVNAVVTALTAMSPGLLLATLHEVEARFGRTREVRWGARTLDLDLIQYGDPHAGSDVVSGRPHLVLPHPRAHERAFVLLPWLDVDPSALLRLDGVVVPVADLAAGLDTSGVRRLPTSTANWES
ncbi:MAG: 2-amino-4-hydroxy-6-hydroxymethyldihydropteridine diphosphokinase [Ornithinibacter sp.]